MQLTGTATRPSERSMRARNAAPPLLALAYPWLVTLAPGVHPAFLALTIVAPALAFWFAHAHIDPSSFPGARRIAFLAAAAPPLFALIGGWLDGQRSLPFKGLGAWCVIWTVLAIVAAIEHRSASGPQPVKRSGIMVALRFAHGVSAIAVVTFAAAHLSNHLAGLLGGDVHWSMMQWLRAAYRSPLLEAALLACVGFQVVSGVALIWRPLRCPSSLVRSMQLGSGIYMLCFFASHISAVFRARYLRDTDTNWQWLTSSSFLHDDWTARLTPHYWLGVIALGVHASAGLRGVLLSHGVRERTANGTFAVVSLAMLGLATSIMVGLILGAENG
jgi:hypothetical protein